VGRLLLVRHAESEGNRDRVFTATPAVGLTERGREQAGTTADWIGTRYAPRRIVTSPYTRARETAAILAARLGLAAVVEEDLRERDYGRLAGLPYATPRPDFDAARYWLWRPEGGETLVEVAARVGAVLDRLSREDPAGEIVIVSHGAAMMAACRHVTGAWPPAGRVVRNAGVVVVEHQEGSYEGASEAADDDVMG
jgi:probable phosphoglycerate mutase